MTFVVNLNNFKHQNSSLYMKKFKIYIVFIVIFCLPQFSIAWGTLGHKVVGQIAESYLTPKANTAIKDILGDETLAKASIWADFVKSDPSFNYLNNWHYINFKEGLSEKDMKAYLETDTATGAYTKVNFLVKQLKNKHLEKEKKKLYLRLLIHIVGDIHQPLHTGREVDLGGSKIKVLWFDKPASLHSVWDEKMIDHQEMDFIEYSKSINYTTKQQVIQWQKDPISHWLFQSYQLAEQLYHEIKVPNEKLSSSYNKQHIQAANEQLLKGGVRLAGLLNQIFG